MPLSASLLRPDGCAEGGSRKKALAGRERLAALVPRYAMLARESARAWLNR